MKKSLAIAPLATLAVAILAQTLSLPCMLFAQTLQGGVQLNTGDVFSSGSGAQTYTDASSTTCSKGNTSPYAGMNPLECYGVMAPTDSAGKCTLGGMKVLKQAGNTCYYCQAINPPTPGIIIPIDQLRQADSEGYKCGVDQADPNCMAVCTRQSGSGPYVPPAGTRLVPAPPSTGGGVPAPQPPGPKGVKRDTLPPGPPPTKPNPPNLPAIDKAMSGCLSKKLPYLVPQAPQSGFRQTAMASAPASVRATPLDQLPTESQIFLEETAMALQAQAAHDGKYGGDEYNATDARDYMVGWLDHCLLNAGLQQDSTNNSPNDPRAVYANFLGVPLSDHRIDIFSNGYTDNPMSPLPLNPPSTPPSKP